MQRRPPPPDPSTFGEAASGFDQLGRALLAYMRVVEGVRVGTDWNELRQEHRDAVELVWRYPKYRSSHFNTHHVFLIEAQRLAAEGRFRKSGENYRKWFSLDAMSRNGDDVNALPEVKRKWASLRADAYKAFASAEAREEVIRRADQIYNTRNRIPSDRQLAQIIAKEMGIPVETVRRFLKPTTDSRVLGRLKRS